MTNDCRWSASSKYFVQHILSQTQVTYESLPMLRFTYVTTRVDVTAGSESVDNALPCLSSLVLVPVKILPLPVRVLSRTACWTMAISPAISEDGSRNKCKINHTQYKQTNSSNDNSSLPLTQQTSKCSPVFPDILDKAVLLAASTRELGNGHAFRTESLMDS